MAHYVPDVKTSRLVIISPARSKRPIEVKKPVLQHEIIVKNGYNFLSTCPFCLGNEHETPPEISRYVKGENGYVEAFPNNQTDYDWLVRTVPNKYPITDYHEVIIHSPDHLKDIAELDLSQVELLLKTYRSRYNANQGFGNVLIFNNKGKESGESLLHPHSQVVVIPKQIQLDILSLEPVKNVVDENNYFYVYCPDFSQWPYEVWISPKACFTEQGEKIVFGQISDDQIKDLAKILSATIKKLEIRSKELGKEEFSYNFYISPYNFWYLRIIPRFLVRAGFELGTGLNVNSADPHLVAEELLKTKT